MSKGKKLSNRTETWPAWALKIVDDGCIKHIFQRHNAFMKGLFPMRLGRDI